MNASSNKLILRRRLAFANRLQKVIDLADFNDEEKLGKGKEMQDRLSKLVTIFADLDFRGSRAEGDDLLGDAYEYLMRHFATESGKSKGQFYTPAEVSRILAKVVGIGPDTRQDQTVLDPTCGSGSLLLKVAACDCPNSFVTRRVAGCPCGRHEHEPRFWKSSTPTALASSFGICQCEFGRIPAKRSWAGG